VPEAWPPDYDADGLGPACGRCGAFVSLAYYRQWSDNDGELDGCRHCLPRSVRFGDDIYGRDKDEVEAEFRGSDPQDAGRPVAPSSQDPDREPTTPRALFDSE